MEFNPRKTLADYIRKARREKNTSFTHMMCTSARVHWFALVLSRLVAEEELECKSILPIMIYKRFLGSAKRYLAESEQY